MGGARGRQSHRALRERRPLPRTYAGWEEGGVGDVRLRGPHRLPGGVGGGPARRREASFGREPAPALGKEHARAEHRKWDEDEASERQGLEGCAEASPELELGASLSRNA